MARAAPASGGCPAVRQAALRLARQAPQGLARGGVSKSPPHQRLRPRGRSSEVGDLFGGRGRILPARVLVNAKRLVAVALGGQRLAAEEMEVEQGVVSGAPVGRGSE